MNDNKTIDTQIQQTKPINITRTKHFGINLTDLIFGDDNTELLTTHVSQLEKLTNKNVKTEIQHLHTINNNLSLTFSVTYAAAN